MSTKFYLKNAAILTLILSLSAGLSRSAFANDREGEELLGMTTIIGGGTALFITAPHVGTIVVAVVGGLATIGFVLDASTRHKENLPRKADLVEISQTGKVPAPYSSMFEKVRKDNPGKALDNKLLARILIKAVDEVEKAKQVSSKAVATGQKNSNVIEHGKSSEADAGSSALSANK